MMRCSDLQRTSDERSLGTDGPPQPMQIEVRRSLAHGTMWLAVAAVLLTLGGVCLVHFGPSGLALLLGAGLLLGGLWNLVWGAIWLADRSPVLILGADALRACRRVPEWRVSWSVIARAGFSRDTWSDPKESPTLTLFLLRPINGTNRAEIDLAHLDHSPSDILRLIAERADIE